MSGIEGRNPYDDYVTINKELENFDKKLMDKPQIIVANKMDMESSKENLKEFKKKVKDDVYEISAINSEGLDELLIKIADVLDSVEDKPIYNEEEFESHVLYKFKEEQPFEVEKEGDIYIVKGEKIEKLLKMTKFTDEGARRFATKLRKLGVDDKLRELGIEPGDIVRILDFEFEFKD